MSKTDSQEDLIGALGRVAIGILIFPCVGLYLAIRNSRVTTMRTRAFLTLIWLAVFYGLYFITRSIPLASDVSALYRYGLNQNRVELFLKFNGAAGALMLLTWGSWFHSPRQADLKKELF